MFVNRVDGKSQISQISYQLRGRKMNVQSLTSILFIFALFPFTFSAAQDSEEETLPPPLRILEIDDTFKIKNVGSPELLPDGKWAAYTVTTRDFEKNSSKTRIWMMATDNGEPIPMTAEAIDSRAPSAARAPSSILPITATICISAGTNRSWACPGRIANYGIVSHPSIIFKTPQPPLCSLAERKIGTSPYRIPNNFIRLYAAAASPPDSLSIPANTTAGGQPLTKRIFSNGAWLGTISM